MTLKLRTFFSIFAAGSLAIAAVPNAHAVPTLSLSNGSAVVTIADGSPYDFNPITGAVTYIGALGEFNLNVSTGVSKPLLGSATQPYLDLNSVDISSYSGGTLTILFSDDSFGPTSGGMAANIGGTTTGTVSYYTYAGSSLLTEDGPFSLGAFASNTYAPIDLYGPFSLTQKVVINHSAPGATSFNAELKATVADGGSTLALLGLTLLGGAILRYKLAGRASPLP